MSLLSENPVAEVVPDNRVYYRCESTDKIGLDDNGCIVAGFALKPYAVIGHDFIEGEIEAVGSDVCLALDGELIDGAIFRGTITDISYDWETGQADDWKVALVRVDGEDELAEVEKIRQAAESVEQTEEVANATEN